MMPIKIGITGGIGSGKSVVCRLLQLMGVPVYIADDESKRLTQTDPQIRAGLISLLGPDVYKDGRLNKPLLASYLFANAEQAAQVNHIIHPVVRQDFGRWAARQTDARFVAIETAILFESGFGADVDVAVLVTAPLQVRVERAMQRDGAPREAIEQRIRAQMTDEERSGRVQFTILNDGETALIPQVLNLIALLSENNSYLCSAKK